MLPVDDGYGLWLGQCQGCDIDTQVDDIGLCEECAARLERDLIRQRDWAYSVSAYGLTPAGREALRDRVIRRHGADLELIAGPDRSKPKRRGKRRKCGRKKQRSKR